MVLKVWKSFPCAMTLLHIYNDIFEVFKSSVPELFVKYDKSSLQDSNTLLMQH